MTHTTKTLLFGLLVALGAWAAVSYRDHNATVQLETMQVKASDPVLSVQPPAETQFAHWTCSNDVTVLYLVVASNHEFLLFMDTGSLLLKSQFANPEQLENGAWFYYAEVGKTGIAVARYSDDSVALAIGNDDVDNGNPVKFECQ